MAGKHQRIDPGVAEHPEQVLPQKRLPAARDGEEVGAEMPVHPQHEARKADGGHGEQIGDRGRQRPPYQDRQPVDRHAGRAAPQQRNDEVRRSDDRRNAEEDDAEREHVDIDAGIVRLGRIGNVVEPAAIRRLADRNADIKENSGEQVDPVAQRVQARERHVARAEQQRPEEVGEA